jgi:WD40 repeat protein
MGQAMSARFRPVIRVFVSSTFSDLKEERNALQSGVFPHLEHYCQLRGFQFQAIDLRWGVPTEAGRDHRTMQICFDELRRAQEVSPRPNFLVLLGDRYGWRPLAEKVTQKEFSALERAAGELDDEPGSDGNTGESKKLVLRTWYRRDDNAVPAEFLLRSRNDWPDRAAWTESGEAEEWKKVEQTLWAVINRAYPQEGLSGRFAQIPGVEEPLPAIVKFQASATEQEIWRGALAAPEAPDHVVAWYRTIRNRGQYGSDSRAWEFFDPDDSLRAPAAELRDELKRRLRKGGERDILPVEVDLCPSNDGSKLEATRDHLAAMCEWIEARLREIVDEEIRIYWRPSGTSGGSARVDRAGPSEARKLELETQAHRLFGDSRAPKDAFVGRDKELKSIAEYLSDESDHNPLAVCGPSGTGKTALLARAAQVAEEGKRRVIVRFLGTTSQSSNLRGLLVSLCRALRPLKEAEKEVSAELYELQEEFDRLLATATAERPILLFLDALDQLDGADSARQTYWLRTPLPPHVKVVVSSIKDDEAPAELSEPYRALERRKLLGRAIAVESLTAPDAMRVIDLWLQQDRRMPRHKRLLTMEQRQAIQACITPEAATLCRRPLYLRILFEECRLWPSWRTVSADEVGKDTRDLLNGLFTRLESPAVHGRNLVASSLGYLASARRGLSESEMLEVLWIDPQYREHLNEESRKNNHEMQLDSTRIPIAIWSRLRHDLDPYLSEHSAPGVVVLNFYHREVSRFISERFLKDHEDRFLAHRRLAEYFEGRQQPWWREPRLDTGAAHPLAPGYLPNARKADELPQQWLWAVEASNADAMKEENTGAREALESLFECLAFIETKAAAGMTFDLIADFDAAVKATPDERPHRRILRLLERALRRDASAIVLRPHILLQLLWHTCYWHDSPITYEHCKWKRPEDAQDPHLPWNEPGPKLFELMERWLAESKQDGASRRPWLRSQRPSGLPLASSLESILRGHKGAVLSVAVTNDGRRMVSGSSDTTVRLWEVDSGTEKAVLRGHAAAVTGVAITADGLRIVGASEDKTVRMWDAESCMQVGILHGSWRSEVWDSGGGVQFNTLTLASYTLPAGMNAFSSEPHKGFTSVAITPDGNRVVCGSEDDIRVWDPKSGDHITSLLKNVWHVSSVTVTEDGQTIVSNGTFNQVYGGENAKVLVWDAQRKTPAAVLEADPSQVDVVAITPDGRRIASGSRDGTVRVWHSEGGAEPTLFRGHRRGVSCVAVTPAGERIVSGSMDKTVRVWSLENGTELAVLSGHEAEVTCVAVTANGSSIFSGSKDGTVRLWAVGDCENIAAHCEYKAVNSRRWANNKEGVLPGGRRVSIEFQPGAVEVWEPDGKVQLAVIPIDTRFDAASLKSNGRELELSDFNAETVIYALDISAPGKRRVALKRFVQRTLRRIFGIQREDTPLITPTATNAGSDWAEYILQTALRWAFGVQADDAPVTATTTPIAEFFWPEHTVTLSDTREYADAISREAGEAILCTVEAGASVFHRRSRSERTA